MTTLPGSAFYNASQGRWLSRDPIGETSEANLQSVGRNAVVNSIDVNGLFSMYVTLHFDVPAQDMPPGHEKPGVTRWNLRFEEPGIWERCAPGCKRLVGTRMALDIETWFRQGADLNMRNSAGHTLIEHENGHSDIAVETYAIPTDEDLNSILHKCFKESCADAKWRWFLASMNAHYKRTDAEQYGYDISEFNLKDVPGVQEEYTAKLIEATLAGIDAITALLEASNVCIAVR